MNILKKDGLPYGSMNFTWRAMLENDGTWDRMEIGVCKSGRGAAN